MQQHAVVQEREVPLGRRARQSPRDAGGELGVAVRGHVLADPLEVLLGRRRPARAHLLLEVVGDARGARGRAARAARARRCRARSRRAPRRPATPPARAALAHPGDALGVVAVRAALEQRERGEGQPARPVQRRCRHRLERGQRRRERAPGRPGARRRARAAPPRPPPRLGLRAAPAPAPNRSTRSRKRASPRSSSTGRRRIGRARSPASSRSSTQPIGVDRSLSRPGSIAPETISRSIARVIAT